MATSVGRESNCLVDTGPIVALLSRDDRAHDACVEAFARIRGQLFSTEAVLAEALHLLRREPTAVRTCLELFLRPVMLLLPMTAPRLRRCADLMVKYADTPMDYADATLVVLADEFSIGRVFTLDRRGFETYRWRSTKRFGLLP